MYIERYIHTYILCVFYAMHHTCIMHTLHAHTHTYTHTRTHTHARTHRHTHTHAHTHMRAHTHACTHTHAHAHTHARMYVHIHTNTHAFRVCFGTIYNLRLCIYIIYIAIGRN